MGKLAVYRYFTLMMIVVQIVVTIFTFIGIFGGNANPATNTASAMLVYVLPMLIVANCVLLVFWLLKRNWIISGVAAFSILACIPYLLTIYQFGGGNTIGENAKPFKVATYNVARFGNEASGFMAADILAEMKKQSVDVFCIQEYNEQSGDKNNSQTYKDYFPYMAKGNADMVIFSRYPIVKVKNLPFEDTNNSAMWAIVNVGGKRIQIFNVHMETTGFNRTLRHVSKMEDNGQSVESNTILQAIYSNYTKGMVNRARQADMVAEEIGKAREQVIVCGDFNDVPYSYTYNTLLGDLVDGFKECGSGWAYTFRGKKKVRIDYIFHSEMLEGVNYYKTEMTYSDHFPVFMAFGL